MKLFNWNNDKADEIVYDKIISQHEKIEVHPGKCRYNFRCQMNAVHEAKKKGDEEIVMTVYMDNRKMYPIIHFLNYRNGKFIDNTLGYWCENHDYYFIKFIKKEEFNNINHIFTCYADHLKSLPSWWIRLTSDRDY